MIICPATSFSYYPHRLQKVIKGILRPWKLTDEHAHTSGQVSDGVFKLLSAQKPVFPITRILFRLRVSQKTTSRVGDFDPLNMFKGIVFLFSIFLKLNSDHFPFF